MGGPIVRTASPSAMREVNRSILLTLIRLYQPISRIGLSRRTGFSFSNVNEIIKQLIDEDLLTEQRAKPEGRGRVPVELCLNDAGVPILGVSIRSSKTTIALAGLAGTVRATREFPTPADPHALVRQIAAATRSFQNSPLVTKKAIRAIGISFPGLVNAGTGKILLAPVLPGYTGFPLAEKISSATGVTTLVENDCNLGALAELWLSGVEGLNLDGFVFVEIGDVGVGGGIIMHREVYRGHDLSYAAEFGHLIMDINGPQCSCGRRGCWEQYVCNRATWHRYCPQKQFEPEAFRELIERSASGDCRAVKALLQTAEYLSAGLSSIACIVNPDLIILCGQITQAWPQIGPTVERAFSSDQFRLKLRVAHLSSEELFLHGAITIGITTFFGKRELGILPSRARKAQTPLSEKQRVKR
jgi:predicted NBD/HSP70 family sugar kinase